MRRKIAFYAPMKAPTHATPSGDRRMARLLWKLMETAGFEPTLASDFRSFDKSGDPEHQQILKTRGLTIADRLITQWEALAEDARPSAWFTYHLYHKAPDWLGPKISAHFNIPYLVAEASHAPKRKSGPWRLGYDAAEAAIRQADRIFFMTRLDGECLRMLTGSTDRLIFLPPFLENDFKNQLTPDRQDQVRSIFIDAGGTLSRKKLLCVAMMRSGDKMASYRQLADALSHLSFDDWQLIVVGDGEEASQIKGFFSEFGDERIIFVGQQPIDRLPAFYDLADLYVWPAVGEAYGMAFLEAQACGLPVVAGNIRGVPDVVKQNVSGILVPPDDNQAFADAVGQLLADVDQRAQMSKAAPDFVRSERSFDAATDILKKALEGLIK